MIGFVRGPGGAFVRLTSEIVPSGGGVVAAGLVLPLAGLPWALGALVVAWVSASALLRFVRRRHKLRLVYRLGLAAHVVFWSALGFAASDRRRPGEAAVETRESAWRELGSFRAGYAAEVIVPPARTTVAGWGTKPRRLTYPPFAGLGVLGKLGRRWMGSGTDGGGPRAPLFVRPRIVVAWPEARAVVLAPEGTGTGAPLALVRIDLVTSDAALARAVHAGVTDLGFPPEGVLVAATHTHSSPGGFSAQPFSAIAGTDHFDPAAFAAIRDAAVRAIRHAHRSAVPARITLLRGRDLGADGTPVLARSRRKEAPDRIDDRVYALRFDALADDRPVALLLNYPVHPVLVRRGYVGWHRDLAGAIENAFEERLPGHPPVLFLNGAAGDIAPRDHRLAGADREHVLAAAFADRVVYMFASGPRVAAASMQLGAALVRRDPGEAHLVINTGKRAAWLDTHGGPMWVGSPRVLASKLVALPANVYIWSLGLPEVQVGFDWDGSVGAVVNLDEQVSEATLAFGAVAIRLENGDRTALIWLPGECTQQMGRNLRAQARARGFEHAMIVGFVNGSCAYVTTEAEYRADTYEARGTLFGPRTGRIAAEAVDLALESTGRLLAN